MQQEPDALSKIELYITPPLKGRERSTAEILDRFVTFTRITSVHVEMNEYMPFIGNASAMILAQAWPALTHLYLLFGMNSRLVIRGPERTLEAPTEPTIMVAGLTAFARTVHTSSRSRCRGSTCACCPPRATCHGLQLGRGVLISSTKELSHALDWNRGSRRKTYIPQEETIETLS